MFLGVTLLLIVANVVVSYFGLTNTNFFERFELSVERIRIYRDHKRLLTSGFLHLGWLHLIVNMFTLYVFGPSLELMLGSIAFLLIYFASLLAGSLFAVFVHRNASGYASVGASGAVCGVMFAVIALSPGMGIGLFFLPISFPAWLYGLAFVIYSIYGIRSRRGNTGHDAHLAGALAGMLIAILFEPRVLLINTLPIVAIGVPAIAFMALVIARPHLLIVDKPFRKPRRHYTVEDRYNAGKINEQAEVDRILEKIHRRGIESLTRSEKELLDRYSRTAH